VVVSPIDRMSRSTRKSARACCVFAVFCVFALDSHLTAQENTTSSKQTVRYVELGQPTKQSGNLRLSEVEASTIVLGSSDPKEAERTPTENEPDTEALHPAMKLNGVSAQDAGEREQEQAEAKPRGQPVRADRISSDVEKVQTIETVRVEDAGMTKKVLVQLISLLSALLVAHAFLVCVLFFILRRYGAQSGALFRIELVSQGAGAVQVHQKERTRTAGYEWEEESQPDHEIMRRVFEQNVQLREQIGGLHATA